MSTHIRQKVLLALVGLASISAVACGSQTQLVVARPTPPPPPPPPPPPQRVAPAESPTAAIEWFPTANSAPILLFSATPPWVSHQKRISVSFVLCSVDETRTKPLTTCKQERRQSYLRRNGEFPPFLVWAEAELDVVDAAMDASISSGVLNCLRGQSACDVGAGNLAIVEVDRYGLEDEVRGVPCLHQPPSGHGCDGIVVRTGRKIGVHSRTFEGIYEATFFGHGAAATAGQIARMIGTKVSQLEFWFVMLGPDYRARDRPVREVPNKYNDQDHNGVLDSEETPRALQIQAINRVIFDASENRGLAAAWQAMAEQMSGADADTQLFLTYNRVLVAASMREPALLSTALAALDAALDRARLAETEFSRSVRRWTASEWFEPLRRVVRGELVFVAPAGLGPYVRTRYDD